MSRRSEVPPDVDRFLRVKAGAAGVRGLPRGIQTKGVRSLTTDQGLLPANPNTARKLDTLGQALFRLAIPRRARARFVNQWQDRQGRGARTRVWIELPDARAHGRPWELLSDPSHAPEAFLALERYTPVIRCLKRPTRRRQLPPIEPPLRILVVISSPIEVADLDVKKEKKTLNLALRELVQAKLVEVAWVTGKDTAGQLLKMFNAPDRSWHVVHFIGHGGFDSKAAMGEVVFTDEDGHAKKVKASGLKALLAHASLRMVVLNSCHGALSDGGGLFSSTAAKLAQTVPAVIAMQTAISDKAALAFSQSLYDRLAGGLPVERAVTEARIQMSLGEKFIEWPTPVLYLSTLDGHVFPLTTLKGRPKEPRPDMHGSPSSKNPDDPTKGQFGGEAERNGRVLSATVEAVSREWFKVQLLVESRRGAKKLNGTVTFHLHNSFDEPVQTVRAKEGSARLSILAWGAFTVGVEADGGKTRLELDLSVAKGAPRKFRLR